MGKNIVVCLDGTWNDKDNSEAMSNVALLHDMCLNQESRQIIYYDEGVGSDGWYDKKLGGVHGVGLSKNIREAYKFISQHYKENDRLYVFGFSRGAYTARSLAGLLFRCGLGQADDQLDTVIQKLYTAYRAKDTTTMTAFKTTNRSCSIAMLGVWDTVGALGIPVSFLRDASSKLFSFHDTALSPEVELACHAVALDEKRESFEPTLWTETADSAQRIKQVWFAGVHSDIGGGYVERHHSDLVLKWMVDHATKAGLHLDKDRVFTDSTDLTEDIHNSVYRLFGKDIGVKPRDAPPTTGYTPRIHKSVLDKMNASINYQPLAIQQHILDTQTLHPYPIDE